VHQGRRTTRPATKRCTQSWPLSWRACASQKRASLSRTRSSARAPRGGCTVRYCSGATRGSRSLPRLRPRRTARSPTFARCVRAQTCPSLSGCPRNAPRLCYVLVRQEVHIGTRLPLHANILAFEGVCNSCQGQVSVWELVHGEDLQSLFARKAVGTPSWHPKEKYVLRWSKQLFSALACLHAEFLIHRDVKPANVLVTHDFMTLKLIDFGLCRQDCLPPRTHPHGPRHYPTACACSDSQMPGKMYRRARDERDSRPMSGITGSYRYMAPEVTRSADYDEKVPPLAIRARRACSWRTP